MQELFWTFLFWEFFTNVENFPVNFPNKDGWNFVFLWRNNRTIPYPMVWLSLLYSVMLDFLA